jgi:biopolymer transport protein ExbD
MTPMVDVVMVILVFFMASTAVLGPEWFLRSSLPVVSKGATTSPDAAKQKRLSFDMKPGLGGAVYGGEGITDGPVQEFAAKVKAAVDEVGRENVIVLLSSAPDVPYQAIVRAHEECRRLGVEKVGMRERAEGK